MYNYDIQALERVTSALHSIRPTQIDMAYWRRTRPGLSLSQTVACAGGWVCLLGTFFEQGLQLIASHPDSPDFGYVPAIRGQHGQTLYGYSAMGYILQARKDNDFAHKYGHNIFALHGRGLFDAEINLASCEQNAKMLVNLRILYAKKQMEPAKPPAASMFATLA